MLARHDTWGRERAPLYRRAVASRSLAETVPSVGSSLDVEQVLTDIVTQAVSLLKAETGDIILKDAEKGLFRVVAAARYATGVVGQEYPLDQGLAARVLDSGRTIIVPDYSTYEHRIRTIGDYGFTATMSSPLIARGEPIGVLTVEHTDPDARFSEDDASLLTLFANHAAVALDNARRYENEVALARDLARANEELSRSLMLQRRLVDQVLADRGPAAVAEELVRILDRSVVLQDRVLRVIAGAEPGGADGWRDLALPHAALTNAALLAQLEAAAIERQPAMLPDDSDGTTTRLVAPVVAGDGDVAGYLVIGWSGEPTPLDRALIDLAATGVALELLKISARAEVEQTVRGDLATDLVNGAYGSDEVITARAAKMGYDLSEERDVVILRLDGADELATRLPDREALRLKRRVFNVVAADVCMIAPASVVAALDDRVLVLAAQCARDQGGYGDQKAKEIAEALRRRLQTVFPDHSFSAVVADRCCAPADYGPSFDLARRGLDAMVKLGKRGVVVDARELGMYGLLVEAAEHDELRAHVEASLAPLLADGVRGQELLATFDAYVGSGFNQRETARRSYLHINTVANRLDRIGQRLERDLSDPETLIELALALRLAKLIGIV
jgi:DNA-binding PucR family transcriptional regulator